MSLTGTDVTVDDQPNVEYFTSSNLIGNFPNPAKDFTTIKYQLEGNLNHQNAVIQIFNIIGELVKTVNGTNGAATLDVSNFTSGIYFYKLQIDDFNEANKMLIVRP